MFRHWLTSYLLPKSEISDPDIDLMVQKFSSLAGTGHSKAGQVEVGMVIAKKKKEKIGHKILEKT